ncbi:MAG: adenylosuccinate synthetase, partial [Lachnospiraceae bacterium]|nr:adenylosuccinate synthetase [Lachnospiraceae bacterium]
MGDKQEKERIILLKRPYISVVIGKGFGDEGKGMAVDFLASRHNKV